MSPPSTRAVLHKRTELLLALALPGCLLLDPPETVRPDEEGGSDNQAGIAGKAGAGSGGSGGRSGAGGRGGSDTGGAGEGGKGATSGGGNSSAGKSGAGGSSGRTAGTSGSSGAAVSAGGAAGSAGSDTAGTGAVSAGSGGSAGSGAAAVCGNGLTESGEDCDDDGTLPGDGCSPTCKLESGWNCTSDSPSTCTATYPSCANMAGNECQGSDCCESLPVRSGTFDQGDASEGSFESSVADFKLDRFEVTVARFRAFWQVYDDWRPNNPPAGAGAHPNIGGSGWDVNWELATTAAYLAAALNCHSDFQTWAGNFGNDTLPLNCIDWYTAFAFCVWDGGRLPTEAEWEIAARWAGYEFIYPWGNTPVLSDALDESADYAVYNCLGDGTALCDLDDIQPVGSKPDGAGRYLQEDMVGSVYEWTLDWYAPYPTSPRMNYAKVDAGTAVTRVVRGGSWSDDASHQTSILRTQYDPATIISYVGLRCARSP